MCCVKRRLQRRYYRHYDFKRCCSAIGKGDGSTIVYYLKCLLSDFLSRLYVGIPFDDSDDPSIVKEVLDILEMWDSIEWSYKRLSDGEKRKLEEAADPYGKEPIFCGFDGNNESSYMGTALFIVNDLARFVEFRGRDLNSHCPSIDAYKRMLVAYRNIRHSHGYEILSVDHLAAILNEMMHPSNR